jgi:putative tryptophan/tyrosine transport system substrate-binding protein
VSKKEITMRLCTTGLVVTLPLAVLVAPLVADAQPRGSMPRIGVLSSTSPAEPGAFLEGFRHGLHELGWVEGQSIVVEWRWAEGQLERLPELAADLVRRNVEVIVAAGTPSSLAAKHATTTIPIVASAGDLVHLGLVASLARPSGNLTGVTALAGEGFSGKWLELLKETAPTLSRVAYLLPPANLISVSLCKAAQDASPALRVTVEAIEVRRPDELDRAFAMMAERAEALIVDADVFFAPYRTRIVEFAAHHRLPAMYHERSYVDAGGLMSYGPSFSAVGRRVATYVDKILTGTKPADLPVEQPTKFELRINLKTAQALGITMPSSLLLLADEVLH